jgi:hypothetical protein
VYQLTEQEAEWLQMAGRDRMMNEWATDKHPELLTLPEAEQVAIKQAITLQMSEHDDWEWNCANVEAAFCVAQENRTVASAKAAGERDLNSLTTDQLREHFLRMDAGRSKSSYVR